MAFPIIPIRNAVATSEAAPLAGSLQLAELAVNTQTGKLYFKGNSGVVEIGGTQGALTTNDLTQMAIPGKIPQLDQYGLIATPQIQDLQIGQLGCLTTTPVAHLVPQLGADGKIPASLLPPGIAGALTYQGAWTVNTSPVIASGGVVGSGVAQKGDYYIAANTAILDTPIDGQSVVQAGDMIAYNGTTWDFIDGAKSEVRSVNSINPSPGGNVELTAANIGAVSTAQLTQLATPAGVPQLNASGAISTAQLQVASVSQLGVISVSSDSTNGLYVSATGVARVIPGTSTVIGGIKSSASIEIALDGTATVASAGTY